ncbi:uncharacterized protein LOC126752013 [Bactrocera neohumeralis]|uniref:uncharacterized protein LOC120767252 n=1 Tax=Bactrocera tryoni TaxID=59916 RepID=UPI001A96B420|nr:uncharacterized protein LOC120767252 [Bactrocera tryoni]XP_050318492.1 uncharacterized protein LOC126752013 [Bactrocera neohumeralis]
MCLRMTNVLTGLLSFFLITAVIQVSAEDAFTIFLDGGKEFSAIKADVDAIRISGNKFNTDLSNRLNEIESSIEKLTGMIQNLAKNMESLKGARNCKISISDKNRTHKL